MKKCILLFFLFFCASYFLSAQVNFTANEKVIPYQGYFRPGANIGIYPAFTDEQLASLAAGDESIGVKGVGVRSFRPSLPEHFLEQYGYDYRVPTYQFYDHLGLKENTLIVGYPKDEHQDTTKFCPNIRSVLFANLYTPIWDGGANGTPYNDDNYYAAYLYKIVSKYKNYVKFWEIWNEPGYDYTGAKGWLPQGEFSPGNWWDNNPNPCDYKLRAPIFHYVRLLRISWEIIKTLDPDGYVVLSGTGYPSFLDAILRNTDNPNDGSISANYPLKGGAYFDVMGFHSYPHFDGSLREWDNSIFGFKYYRHSDAAAKGIVNYLNIYNEVLAKYGYDGKKYPNKEKIITEGNMPRREFGEFIGSDLAQRNYIIKAVVECIRHDVWQFHLFKLAEDKTPEEATYEFDLMGLYEKFDTKNIFRQKATPEGTAYKTTSDILFETRYDTARTRALQLPNTIDGGAFRDKYGNFTYVLWAKTTKDKSEIAAATYSFPSTLGLKDLLKRDWDHSNTKDVQTVATQNIALTATPTFFTENRFEASVEKGCAPLKINFAPLSNFGEGSTINWTFKGGSPETSQENKPSVLFNQAGTYEVTLEIKDAAGNIAAAQTKKITVVSSPKASFSYTQNGPIVLFNNKSSTNAEKYTWFFGDSQKSTAISPNYVYATSGDYKVRLIAENNCGTDTSIVLLTIAAPTAKTLAYTANDSIISSKSLFRPGTNLEYYPNWTDEQLADIAAGNLQLGVSGIGVKSFRALLPDYFLRFWGAGIRKNTFQHYVNLDLKENTVILGFPAPEVADKVAHCPGEQSQMFANLYLDIWDKGEKNTPVNDDNYFAAYIYNTVTAYKDYVKFWEILSTPGYEPAGLKSWLPKGQAGNWWENNPEPCELAIKAPVFYYIRMLRIAYEVIKSIDPNAYVTLSGISNPSFLDVIVRNTDNPLDGKANNFFPLTGGAYFDVVGIHSYPHVDGSMRYWDNAKGTFVYTRHSDAAANSILNFKKDYQNVLNSRGYDGKKYKNKLWTVSEGNIPRRQFGEYYGSDEAQRNYVMKTFVNAMTNNFLQFDVFRLAEQRTPEEAVSERDLMGLYQNLNGKPYAKTPTLAGNGYNTASQILYGLRHDVLRTDALMLPEGIAGAAFVDDTGKYVYVLWAKTLKDQSESAQAVYSFPTALKMSQVFRREWDFSNSQKSKIISTQNIALTAVPTFFTDASSEAKVPTAAFSTTSALKGCGPFKVAFKNESTNATNVNWVFEGGIPATSKDPNPVVEYKTAGTFSVSLSVSNEIGEHNLTQPAYISVATKPKADFNYAANGLIIQFNNSTKDAEKYIWSFGDGSTATALNTTHAYKQKGIYKTFLAAGNACGADTIRKTLALLQDRPKAAFKITATNGYCTPASISFQDASTEKPDSWSWSFGAGVPSASKEANPTVIFSEAGTYNIQLLVKNPAGFDTLSQKITIGTTEAIFLERTICENDSILVNGKYYGKKNPTGEEIFKNSTKNGCDSIVSINLTFRSLTNHHIIDTLRNGQPYHFGNETFSKPGDYILKSTDDFGCDIIVNITLYAIDHTTSTQNVVAPETFTLSCVPNPFSNEAKILFTLSESSKITLEIADVHGRLIEKILHEKILPSGEHHFYFHQNNLSTGIYFCKLRSENKTAVIKLIKK